MPVELPVQLVVVLWGLLAIATITAVGRWCRAHPGAQDSGPDGGELSERLPEPVSP